MNIHCYILVDFIFDGRLNIQQLIERSKSVFNTAKLDNDFWFYLLWKHISYKNGSTDEISAEGLFNKLLEFSRKVEEAYENLATRTIESLQNNV